MVVKLIGTTLNDKVVSVDNWYLMPVQLHIDYNTTSIQLSDFKLPIITRPGDCYIVDINKKEVEIEIVSVRRELRKGLKAKWFFDSVVK